MPNARTAKSQQTSIEDAWAEVARVEKDFVGSATKVAERMPAPVDVLDSSLLFASRILRSQRDALVPLLKGVGPKTRKGQPGLTPAADAVKRAFDLAENVVDTQRRVLHGLVETVTPPLARHAPRTAKPSAAPRRTATSRATARPKRTTKRTTAS